MIKSIEQQEFEEKFPLNSQRLKYMAEFLNSPAVQNLITDNNKEQYQDLTSYLNAIEAVKYFSTLYYEFIARVEYTEHLKNSLNLYESRNTELTYKYNELVERYLLTLGNITQESLDTLEKNQNLIVENRVLNSSLSEKKSTFNQKELEFKNNELILKQTLSEYEKKISQSKILGYEEFKQIEIKYGTTFSTNVDEIYNFTQKIRDLENTVEELKKLIHDSENSSVLKSLQETVAQLQDGLQEATSKVTDLTKVNSELEKKQVLLQQELESFIILDKRKGNDKTNIQKELIYDDIISAFDKKNIAAARQLYVGLKKLSPSNSATVLEKLNPTNQNAFFELQEQYGELLKNKNIAEVIKKLLNWQEKYRAATKIAAKEFLTNINFNDIQTFMGNYYTPKINSVGNNNLGMSTANLCPYHVEGILKNIQICLNGAKATKNIKIAEEAFNSALSSALEYIELAKSYNGLFCPDFYYLESQYFELKEDFAQAVTALDSFMALKSIFPPVGNYSDLEIKNFRSNLDKALKLQGVKILVNDGQSEVVIRRKHPHKLKTKKNNKSTVEDKANVHNTGNSKQTSVYNSHKTFFAALPETTILPTLESQQTQKKRLQ